MPIERAKITYAVRLEPEDTPVRGNAMASGDDSADAACEEWILSRLNAGELSAWCVAIVTATVQIEGQRFQGEAALGCCSYESEEECKADMLSEESGMLASAREHLEEILVDASRRGHAARTALEDLRAIL